MLDDYKNINGDPDLLIRLLEKKVNDLIHENVLLRNENRNLKITLNSGKVFWWEYNLITGEVNINPNLIQNLGYTFDEINEVDDQLKFLVYPEDYSKLIKAIEKLIAGNDNHISIDYRIKDKNEKTVWISDTISVFERDAEGTPIKLLAISINNDEKKRFEIALHKMLNNSLFGFVIFKDEKIVFVNENASKLIGFSKEEILSFTKDDIARIVYPDDIELFIKQYREYETYNPSLHKFIFRIVNKSGKIIWLNANFSNLLFNGNETLQLTFIDITDLIRTEEEKLQISEDFIKTIQELNIHIFRFKKVNDEFINTFSAGKLASELDISKSSHSRDERNILTVFGKEHYEIFHENFEKAFDGNEIVFSFSKNNKWYTVNLVPYQLDSKGKTVEILGKINDITLRYEAEQKIRKTNERLEIAHSAGNIAWWELDYETQTVECDKNYATILGFDESEFPISFEERLKLIHPNHLPDVEEKVQEHIKRKTDFYEITYLAKTKAGNYKWVYDRGKIISRNEFDEPSKMIGVFMDVSQLKEAEAKYKLEAEKGNAILKAIPDSMFIFDKEYRYVDYYVKNPDLLFAPPEEFLGKRVDEVLPPINNENILDQHFQLVTEHPGKVNTFEYSVIKEKEPRYFESRVVFTGSFYLVMDREITNEKRHHLKVNEIAKRFRLATKTAQMGIWDWDISKDKLLWDSGMYKIYETEKHNSIINFDFWRVRIFPEDRILVEKAIEDALKFDKEFNPEYRIVTGSGKTKYIKAFGQVFKDSNNNPIRMIGLNMDITERKLMEIELEKAKEKAEQSDKLKSEFLAQMSHEIRTPVNSLLSFASLIREEMKEIITEDVEESFKVMSNAGRRIIRTIDLILNMSEVQTKSYEAVYEKIDLYEEIITEQNHEFKFIAREKGLNFSVNNNADNTIVIGDKYTIGQIFNNLIDNAIKYTREGFVNVNFYNKNKNLCVEIEDSGIGISEEYKKNIFIPFTQEDSGYTRKYEGNGLGLALVKEYCRINNAEITFSSEKGNGTTFTIIFKNYEANK